MDSVRRTTSKQLRTRPGTGSRQTWSVTGAYGTGVPGSDSEFSCSRRDSPPSPAGMMLFIGGSFASEFHIRSWSEYHAIHFSKDSTEFPADRSTAARE